MRYIKSYANDAAIQEAIDNKSLGKPYVALNESAGTIDWNGKDIDYSKMYLTIEALSGGTFYVRNADVSYSVNGGAWETTTGETGLALNQGDAVRFKKSSGKCDYLFTGNTLSFNVYGNIQSLVVGDNFESSFGVRGNQFEFIFSGCTGMENAENLIMPATSLYPYCYRRMFQECSNLKTSPKILPAETIPMSAYDGMFNRCSNLVTSPVICATTLNVQQSCIYMFSRCYNLEKAPELLTSNLTPACYQEMFLECAKINYIKCLAENPKSLAAQGNIYNWLSGVSPTGTFVKKAGVTWPTGASGIPDGWTVIEE